MTHTPGPWELSDCGGHVIGQADQDDILEVANLEGTFNHESNARVIAAAPEMLAALERIVKLPRKHELADWWSVCEQAKSAIAKAKGEVE